jgi:CheY-like chemotaxis protein
MSALRVLHVDDEPDIREIAALALGLDPEIKVRGCGCGQDAVTAAASWSPDVILLDVMMPVMDGPTTLAELRKSPKTSAIPVVFMTARAQPRELEHFVSLGAEGVIPKPFDPMTLAASVRTYAKGSQFNIAERRDSFLVRARNNAELLRRYRREMRVPVDAAGALGRIRVIAHSLAGAAGVFGLPQMSAAATAVEDVVIDRLDGRIVDVEVAIDALLVMIERTEPSGAVRG